MAAVPEAFAAPLPLIETEIETGRVNVLGHMRAAQYVAVFDDAFLAFVAKTGLTGPDLRHGSTSPFLLDLHATYLAEIKAGERVAVTAHVLECDARRARLMLVMQQMPAGRRAATCELAILNMDLVAHRPAPWSGEQAAIWAALIDAHRALAPPPEAGRAIGPLVRG